MNVKSFAASLSGREKQIVSLHWGIHRKRRNARLICLPVVQVLRLVFFWMELLKKLLLTIMTKQSTRFGVLLKRSLLP